jgi:hypothetical protein
MIALALCVALAALPPADAGARASAALPAADAGTTVAATPAAAPTLGPDAGPAESPSYQTRVVAERPDSTLTGSSATTVTRQELQALPGGDTQTLAHLIAMQPGVVEDNFGSNLHVRGADGAILYVLDGVPIFAPAVGTIGQLYDTLPTRLIQSFDFYTGGFPVDYSYSLGGVADVKTRRATAEPTAEVQATYGTYDLTDLAANYSQTYGGKLGVIASGNFLSTDRGLDTPDAVDVLHDSRLGGNGFVKLDYELGSRDRLIAIGTYQEDEFQIPIDPTMLPLSEAPPGAVRGADVYGNPPPPFVPYDANPTDFERTFMTALSYVHEGDVDGQVSLYAREEYENYDCDPVGSLGPTADPGSTCSSFVRDAYHYGAVGSLAWSWLPGNHWKAGGQVDDMRSSLGASLFSAAAQGGYDPSQTVAGSDAINSLTAGAYLEDRIELGKFTLLPGLRLDVQNTAFGSSGVSPLFYVGPSFRVGASYAPSDKVILHAYVGYLWEAPPNFDGPVMAQYFVPGLTGPQAVNLKPATTWSGELGATVHPVPRLTLGFDAWGRFTYDMLDHQNIGSTQLWASFNWDQGRAAGGDLFASGEIIRFWQRRFTLEGFGNLSYQIAQQLGIATEQYLFPAAALAGSQAWTVMDHVQFWTVNVGLLLHDVTKLNNLSVRFNYGSGFHSGVATNEIVPEHATVDATLSHTFDVPTRPELAFDVFNLFNDLYAYRLGTGYFGNSQFAAPRSFDLRLILHFC